MLSPQRTPWDGAVPLSSCAHFDAKPDAPTQKKRQYYTMLGTRGLWEDGWKAVAVHAPLTGKGHFDRDPWQLYHVDVDRAESNDDRAARGGAAAGQLHLLSGNVSGAPENQAH